jgi:hypothetical protein
MTDYGLTSTGFVRKPLEQILADIETRQRATIAEDLDQSTESIVGQLNGIYAREIALAWEALEDVHDSYDPDKAEDTALVNLAKLTGTEKRDASYSTVTMTVNLDAGTELLSGTHYVASSVDPDIRFTPEADYTAASGGGQQVVFRAENKGAVAAGNGELTIIATPLTGWNSATNGDDATPGREVDTNEIVRERREAQIEAAGSVTLRSLVADVLEVADVDDALGFENAGPTVDENGLPPNSFELVIWDQGGLALDDTIAQVIYDNGHTGIRSFGAESGTAVDENGDDVTENFSRFTERQVYLEFDLEVEDDFAAAAFKLAVATEANATFTGGKEVRVARLTSIALAQDHVIDVAAVRLGFTASPVGTTNLVIGAREISRYDTARIDVTEV